MLGFAGKARSRITWNIPNGSPAPGRRMASLSAKSPGDGYKDFSNTIGWPENSTDPFSDPPEDRKIR